jgi:hypothetical protein
LEPVATEATSDPPLGAHELVRACASREGVAAFAAVDEIGMRVADETVVTTTSDERLDAS